jgi:hypothetical protein
VHSQCTGEDDGSREKLIERVANGDNSLARAVFHWGANITGSDAHLASLKREIDAIITDQLTREEPNPPSLFPSASCAEFHWKQLLSYLSKHVRTIEGDGERGINARWEADPTGDEFQPLRRQKLNEYAHVVTSFFEQRADTFVCNVLVPALGIEEYYMIFEFAEGRGQIHFHLLAWLKKTSSVHAHMHRAMPAKFGGGDLAAAEQAWRTEPLLGEDRLTPQIQAEIAQCGADGEAVCTVRRLVERRELWNRELWKLLLEGSACDRLNAYQLAVGAHQMVNRTVELPASLRASSASELPAGLGDDVKPEARVMAWRALLLEGWMRNHNFRADRPTACADLAIRTVPRSDAMLQSPTTVGRAS